MIKLPLYYTYICSTSNYENMHVAVARGCGNSGTTCSKKTVTGIVKERCGCEGDLCNSSGTTTVSMMAVIAPLLVAKLFN